MKRSVVVILWTIFLLGVLLAPIRESDIPTPGGFKYFDKVAHFCLFAITGFVSFYGTRHISQFGYRMFFGTVFGLFLAVFTELAQSLTATRNTDPYDLLADVLGLTAALLLYALLYTHNSVRSFLKL